MQSFRCKCSRTHRSHDLYYLHTFHHFFLYSLYSTKTLIQSTKSPNHTFANYLVNHLGFSPHQALSTSTKLRSNKVNDFSFSDNTDSVVNFFKQHDFDDTHIKKIVSSYPRILAANVDKTLIPKFKLLQNQGFSGSDLVSVIASSPSFLLRHMDSIIPDLRAILGSNENIMKLFRKSHFVTTTSGLVNLNSNIALLNNEYGLDIQVIRNSILQHPQSYLRNPEFFRDVLVKVEEELGIPTTSGMFLYGMHLLCKCSKKIIELKCQVLRSFGWTEYYVSELMRRNPQAFLISEENIRKKLGFLMTELGFKPDYLVTHSFLLGYSLEKRMAPRHRILMVLKEKGLLDYNFYSAITRTETQFLKVLVEPFKEDAPGLLELYQSNKGCSNIDATSR